MKINQSVRVPVGEETVHYIHKGETRYFAPEAEALRSNSPPLRLYSTLYEVRELTRSRWKVSGHVVLEATAGDFPAAAMFDPDGLRAVAKWLHRQADDLEQWELNAEEDGVEGA